MSRLHILDNIYIFLWLFNEIISNTEKYDYANIYLTLINTKNMLVRLVYTLGGRDSQKLL